ncbi:hypothetical protein SO694_00003752 [Aureococcus anophagefferens]|uniref:Uncharacterized protein n=1 Tax=Aureococcus anophagefferens TaxID=44056 RepID=A0ABR1GE23_AURAN
MCLATAAWAFSAGAARTLAGGALKLGDLAADGGPLVRASAALREALGAGGAAHEAYDRDNRTIYFASVPATLVADAPLTLSKPTDRRARRGRAPFRPSRSPGRRPEAGALRPRALRGRRGRAAGGGGHPAGRGRRRAPRRARPTRRGAAAGGEKKRLAAEQASFLEVTCPTGFGPGDALWVRGPDGTQVKATVRARLAAATSSSSRSRRRRAPGGDDPRADAATVVASQHPESTIDSFFQRGRSTAPGRRTRRRLHGQAAPAPPPAAPPAAPAPPRTAPPPAPPAAGAAAFGPAPSAPSTTGTPPPAPSAPPARAAAPGADADAALARRLAAENAAPPPSEADDLRVAQQLRIQLDEERRQQEARDEAFARSLAQQGPSAPPNPF